MCPSKTYLDLPIHTCVSLTLGTRRVIDLNCFHQYHRHHHHYIIDMKNGILKLELPVLVWGLAQGVWLVYKTSEAAGRTPGCRSGVRGGGGGHQVGGGGGHQVVANTLVVYMVTIMLVVIVSSACFNYIGGDWEIWKELPPQESGSGCPPSSKFHPLGHLPPNVDDESHLWVLTLLLTLPGDTAAATNRHRDTLTSGEDYGLDYVAHNGWHWC